GPLRSAAARGRRQPVPARFAEAPHPAGRLYPAGAAVPRAQQRPPGRGRTAGPLGSRSSRPALGHLRGDGDPRRAPVSGRRPEGPLMDLSTRYLGLALRNPLVAPASPISNTLDGVRRLADAGVGAVVLFSLFEEQLRDEAEQNARLADAGTDSFAESLSYFPAEADADP